MPPTKIALLAVVILMVSATPAVAKQLDASEDPTVAGPLSTNKDLKGCTSQDEKGPSGRLVARFHVCSTYYLFDPEQETDQDRDYGALWVQVTVDSKNGWCTRELRTDVAIPEKGVHTKAPKPGTTVTPSEPRKYTTKLKVDAEGAAKKIGTLVNSFRLYKKRLKAKVTEGGDFRVVWNGNANRKIAIISGLEISWPPGGQPPALVPRIHAQFRKGGC